MNAAVRSVIRTALSKDLEAFALLQGYEGLLNDEFYPYERGWVGPSAFTCFTIIEAYNILQDEINEENNTTLIFSTHDPDIMKKAHRVIRIHDGKIDREEINA